MKLSLLVVGSELRIPDIIALLTDSNWGGVAGDPGWIIHRDGDPPVTTSENSTSPIIFTAEVDPEDYPLTFPTFSCDGVAFMGYLTRLADALEADLPDLVEIRDLRAALALQ
ncbi:hypothetical protein ABIC65_001338 [Sphingomonas trueperi]|uniref:hypothetical protein n=1 Tax=Sphingomonas trueperi TaxID=53317 RepID=UPI0033910026